MVGAALGAWTNTEVDGPAAAADERPAHVEMATPFEVGRFLWRRPCRLGVPKRPDGRLAGRCTVMTTPLSFAGDDPVRSRCATPRTAAPSAAGISPGVGIVGEVCRFTTIGSDQRPKHRMVSTREQGEHPDDAAIESPRLQRLARRLRSRAVPVAR